jgi:hypothetical protein
VYTIDVAIRGTSPLLQHAFPQTTIAGLMEGTKKRTGTQDYSLEWMDTMYVDTQGFLYQPATHIEGAMVRSAAYFKVAGGRGKTYKDVIRAHVYVSPDRLIHQRDGGYVIAPGTEILTIPRDDMRINVTRVVVQRSAVARARLEIDRGWELAFCFEVLEDGVRADDIRKILEHAGKATGIGDWRPKYGKFEVAHFQAA